MSRVQVKKVKVLHNGPIKAKGWVYGPILSPYMESTKIIFAMLKDGIKVVEVLKDNSELRLNATNFDKDNNKGLIPEEGLGDDDLFQPAIHESSNTVVETQEIVAEEIKATVVDMSDAQIEETTVIEPLVDQEVKQHEFKKKKKNK